MAVAVIEVDGLVKHYSVHERPPGVAAALRSLISRPKRLVKAVDRISFQISGLALLGRATRQHLVTALAVAAGLSIAARFAWLRALRAYTGASS